MLTTMFAFAVIILGLVCWIGQTLGVLAPNTAVRLGFTEPASDMDRSMYLFERYSQGVVDMALTWLLPAAALMMLLDIAYWPVPALIGGGVYLYFPGVFMITRIVLGREGKKIGRPASVLLAYILGALWIVSALGMISLAVLEGQSAIQ